MTRLEALALTEASCLVLRLTLVAPVALEIPGSSPGMAAAAAGITTQATSTIHCHALATAVTTTAASEARGWCDIRLGGGLIFVRLVGIRTGELETSGCSFLLRKLGRLLSISQS